jgi:hypothetical protein
MKKNEILNIFGFIKASFWKGDPGTQKVTMSVTQKSKIEEKVVKKKINLTDKQKTCQKSTEPHIIFS